MSSEAAREQKRPLPSTASPQTDDACGDGRYRAWEIEAMLVRDVMRKPISVHAEETLEVATLRLKKENVGALPVVEDDEVVGMITDRDVLLRGFPEGRNIHTKTRESRSA